MKRTLIHELNDLQAEQSWLRREDLERLSRRTGRPLYEVQGLSSFYPHYRSEPPPRFEVRACRDMSCWLRGGGEQAASLAAELGRRPDVTLRPASCLGRCDSAPAATVNDRPCRTADVAAIVNGGDAPAIEAPFEDWPSDPYGGPDQHYGVLRRALSGALSRQEVLNRLEQSGLRGMGGAGFPAGRKWSLVAAEVTTPKYAICNADESEPGTFKDREIMRQLPHLVLEGLLLGMWTVGASEGIVFVRHEYGPEREVLAAEVERARGLGLVGGEYEVEVVASPGGYILGEESALLECLEGRRGEPRNRPPYPGTDGLWGRPTLVNNVETLHHVPSIVGFPERGDTSADGSRRPLKFISVSGHVERPGVYCVPLGTTAKELIDRAGGMQDGRRLLAFAPGGASSNFLPAEKSDVELDFGPLQEAGSQLGSGAFVAVAEGTDLLGLGANVLEFFANESCGKCVPCRVGSRKAVGLVAALRDRAGSGPPVAAGRPGSDQGGNSDGRTGGGEDSVRTLQELEETLRLTSICGLGQVALGPLMSIIRNFPEAR